MIGAHLLFRAYNIFSPKKFVMRLYVLLRERCYVSAVLAGIARGGIAAWNGDGPVLSDMMQTLIVQDHPS